MQTQLFRLSDTQQVAHQTAVKKNYSLGAFTTCLRILAYHAGKRYSWFPWPKARIAPCCEKHRHHCRVWKDWSPAPFVRHTTSKIRKTPAGRRHWSPDAHPSEYRPSHSPKAIGGRVCVDHKSSDKIPAITYGTNHREVREIASTLLNPVAAIPQYHSARPTIGRWTGTKQSAVNRSE